MSLPYPQPKLSSPHDIEPAADRPHSPVAFSAALTLMLIPGILVLGSPRTVLTLDLVPPVIILVWAAFRARSVWQNGAIAPMRLVFIGFMYMSAGIAPLAMNALRLRPNRIDATQQSTAWILIFITIAVWEVSYSALSRSNRIPLQALNKTVPTQRWLYLLAISSLAIQFALFGAAFTISNRSEARVLYEELFANSDGQALIAILQSVIQVPPLVALVVSILELRARPEAPNVRSWLAIMVLVNLLTSSPFISPRFWVATVSLSAVIVAINWTESRAVVLLAALIAFATIAFPFLDFSRYAVGPSTVRDEPFFTTTGILRTIATKDYDQFTMTENGLAFVQSEGHTYGAQAATTVGFALPRAIWPNKGSDTGVLIGEWLLDEGVPVGTTNLSSPLWLEGYIDFGFVGTIILVGFAGAVGGLLDRSFARGTAASRVPTVGVVLCPILAAYSLIIWRGPLLQAAGKLAFITLLCLLLARGKAANEAQLDP